MVPNMPGLQRGATNAGLYMPPLVPLQPWMDISMDFVFCLPRMQHGSDSNFVVVDHFSKMVHFILSKKTTDVVNVAQISFQISTIPMACLLLSSPTEYTVSHPPKDKQTEVVNRSVGDLLRCLVRDHPKSWDMKLSQVKFAHNHAGFSPFQVLYSALPRGHLNLSPLSAKTRIHEKAADFVTSL